MSDELHSHMIQMSFPKEPLRPSKPFRIKTFDKVLSFKSPSHFGSSNKRKIKKMRSIMLSRKIQKYRRIYEKSSTNAHQVLIDYELFNGFNAFCSCFKFNSTLTTLDLSSVVIDPLLMIRLVKSLEGHPTLRNLDISNNNLISLAYKYTFRSLKNTPKLETLNLFNSPVPNESFRELDELLHHNKSLKEINFNFAKMDSEGLKKYFDTLAQTCGIKSIKLANKTLNYSALVGLSYYFSKSPKPMLEELDLSYCNISVRELQIMMRNMPVFRFWRSKRKIYPQIHTIRFCGNRINGKNSINAFKELIDRIQNIYSVDLTKNQITSYDLIMLAQSFRKIQYSINLSHNKLQENFSENIDFLAHLKILNLSANNLSDYSIQIISAMLSQNPNWSSLDLSRNAIENKDLKLLIKGLESNYNLVSLNLASNHITDTGLSVFQESMSLINLRELDLSDNEIGQKGLIHLFPSSKMGSFSLRQIHLNEIYYFDEEDSIEDSDNRNVDLNLRFVEVLSVNNSIFLSDNLMKYLIQADSIIELNLNGSVIDENIMHLSKFFYNSKTLRVLRIHNVGLGALKSPEMSNFWKGLQECNSLETLDISKNKLARCLGEFLECVKNLKNLKQLDLASNLLENEHAKALSQFLSIATINDLDLSSNLFSYMAFECLSKALKDNLHLTSLHLGKMHLDILCLIPLGRVISTNTTLETLDLSGTVFHTTSILELNRKEKGLLTELRFNYMKFESFQYSILLNMMRMEMNPKIQIINLENCQFIRLNLHRLVKTVTDLKFLNCLNLSNIFFTDVEIAEIFLRLKTHSNITELVLKSVDFREKSVRGLCTFIRTNNSLKSIDLSSNKLPGYFFPDVKESMLMNRKLEQIFLNDCQIVDDNLIVILDLLQAGPQIKKVELARNLLSLQALKAIFSRELREQVNLIEKLTLEGNPFNSKEPSSEIGLLETSFKFNPVLDLNLSKSLKLIPHPEVKSLVSFLSQSKCLITLNLNENGLNDDILALISESLNDSGLLFLSIADNRFSLIGLSNFFKQLKKNSFLLYLDVSKSVKTPDEAKFFCDYLQESLYVNNTVQVVDISRNFTMNYINGVVKSVLSHKKLFVFLNEQWQGLRSSQAIRLIESSQHYYTHYTDKANLNPRIEEEILRNKRFIRLDFSKAELDDDFCLFFSDNMHKMPFLKELIFVENVNITLSGLKNIFVGLVIHKENTNLERVHFEKINTKNFLNNGIAASISEWARYGEETKPWRRALQKCSFPFFSRLITINNKFQFSDQFLRFSQPFLDYWIFLFYLINFIVVMTLSITLPVTLTINCQRGHYYASHISYSVYVGITVLIEFTFWIYYKKKLMDWSDYEKKLKREVFLSDILFLLSSAGEKFNLYLDVCFITISQSCGQIEVSNVSIAIVALKFFISTVMAIKSLVKLFLAIRRGNNVAVLNLITKLALIENFYLIGDILDRYVPGNVKRFKKIFGIRLKRSIFVSTSILLAILKFFLEDLPQSIIQCIYVFALLAIKQESNWIIFLNISKNFISLFVSFYGVVTLRPSFIEQADFDERVTLVRLINKNIGVIQNHDGKKMRRSRRATSLLQQGFNATRIEEEIIKMRISLHRGESNQVIQFNEGGFPEKKFRSFLEFGKTIFESSVNTIPSEDFLDEKKENIDQLDSLNIELECFPNMNMKKNSTTLNSPNEFQENLIH